MTRTTLQRSFAGGEITPELYARLDLTKFQTGLALCRNFEILPHGPARNRAGFEYVIATKYSDKEAVLIPYDYSDDHGYVLEVGDQYIRFHYKGRTVLEDAYTLVDIADGVVTYNAGTLDATIANGQWFYIRANGMWQMEQRYVVVSAVNTTNHTFVPLDLFGETIDTSGYDVFTTGTLARVYELATPYLEEHLYELDYDQSGDVLSLYHQEYSVGELRRITDTNWTLTTPSWSPAQSTITGVSAAAVGSGSVAYGYVVTSFAKDSGEESLPSAVAWCNNDLTVQGSSNFVTWTDAADADGYRVYKESNGLYGFVGDSANGSAGFRDDNIAADTSQTPPTDYDPFSTATYPPGCGAHFEGRRWMAGSISKPSTVYATRSGTEDNMSYALPVRDDDSIEARLISSKAESIKYMVALHDMILLTSGSEWRLVPQNSEILTPLTMGYKAQSYIGTAKVKPMVTEVSALFVDPRASRVHQISYDMTATAYKAEDVSIMAPHLSDTYSIRQMAYVSSPLASLWAVRNDGVLLGLTYSPEHQVLAWHQHDTDGTFESVCAVHETVTGVEG